MFSLRKSLLVACVLSAPGAAANTDSYEVAYLAQIRPDSGIIEVQISLSGPRLPSRLVLHTDRRRHRHFTATDPLLIEGEQVTWRPRGQRSRLQYQFVVDHQRSKGQYDSLMTRNWALFRGEKLIPRASVSAPEPLQSQATLQFTLPQHWSIATPYVPDAAQRFRIDKPARRFDQPEGWMLAGRIGQRVEIIGDVQVVVAAPVGDRVRRQDTLAFLNWNLPRLAEVFPQWPSRLLIVSAGDPMWRGGLSGPASMFLHSARPLISENRTSTLLHELVHIAMGLRGDEESDWIVEGFAELYSLQILQRSGSISERRYTEAVASLQKWAQRAPELFSSRSSGATTARAVIALLAVDAEIRKVTGGRASLDELARTLASQRGTITLARLQQTARQIAGRPLQSLERERLLQPVAAPASAAGATFNE